MAKIEMYTWTLCPYCIAARMLLKSKRQAYQVRNASKPEVAEEMVQRCGRSSVPQIFINGRHIGGYDDLSALNQSGQLDKLLAAPDIPSNPS